MFQPFIKPLSRFDILWFWIEFSQFYDLFQNTPKYENNDLFSFFFSHEHTNLNFKKRERNISLFYSCGFNKEFIVCVIVALMTYS